MRAILFCNLPYAFAILKPLEEELSSRGFEILWFVPSEIAGLFPYAQSPYATTMKALVAFQSDMIFVPGNDVPWYLRGVKVQIFHGFAGEKKGHFRIREYFDLYLTQGPYFTKRFHELALKHKNFEVIETGWCKLDALFTKAYESRSRKAELLQRCNAKKLLLFAPTFSPSLTSAVALKESVLKLSHDANFLVHVKFHDKMDANVVAAYKQMAHDKLVILDIADISDAMVVSDLMISDTSSVVYEFIQLDKPVVTLNSTSPNINWADAATAQEIERYVYETLFEDDKYAKNRADVIALYHPYSDGKSAQRMVDATLEYLKRHGVPKKRKISLLRKYKIFKTFGLA
jgi:CDP-glycerol glycerophosphotransferase (TagB/SpsB family)